MIEKVKNVIGFQEHIWVMLSMSFDMARKQWKSGKKSAKGKLTNFDIERKVESEDQWWNLEWKVITIQGDEECERDEYEGIKGIASNRNLEKELKKYPSDDKDERLASVFKSKLVDSEKMKQAYLEGKKSTVKDKKSIMEILNEMGIVIMYEWIPDYDERKATPDITG